MTTETFNFIEIYKINKTICNSLITYFKKNKEYKMSGSVDNNVVIKKIKNSTDVHFYNNSTNKSINVFFNELTKHIKSYVDKYKIIDSLLTSQSNNIQHYKSGGGYPHWHYERGAGSMSSRQLVYMLYLNTVTDKGETVFPYQKVKTLPVKGDLIIWPAEFTHPHYGVISTTQEKYIATGWLELQ